MKSNEGAGSSQVPFLLAERARSECARSMRAVKGSLGRSPEVRWRERRLLPLCSGNARSRNALVGAQGEINQIVLPKRGGKFTLTCGGVTSWQRGVIIVLIIRCAAVDAGSMYLRPL